MLARWPPCDGNQPFSTRFVADALGCFGRYLEGKFVKKAKMLSFDEVETIIGHGVGGVCPFGINNGIVVYLDESLKRFDVVYPACGSSNSAVELTLEELERTSNYLKWIDVCKGV